MKILKWLDDALKSLAQNVSVDISIISVDLISCILLAKSLLTRTIHVSHFHSVLHLVLNSHATISIMQQ